MLFFSLFTSSSLLTRTSRDRWRFPLSLVLYITLYIKPGHPDVTFWLVRSHCEALASWGLKPTRSEDGSELENKDTLWSCDAELSVSHKEGMPQKCTGEKACWWQRAVWKHISGKLTRRKKSERKVAPAKVRLQAWEDRHETWSQKLVSGWCECIKSHQPQKSSGKELQLSLS